MTNPNRKDSSKTLVSLMFVAAAALAMGCSQAAAAEPNDPATPSTESDMKDIESLKKAEKIWADSLTTGDTKPLSALIDDPFTFIGPDGQLEERDAYLGGYEAMLQHGVVVEGIDMSEVKFRVLEETGIVTGRVVARVKMEGTSLVEDVRFTRVYRRTSSGWRMVAGQGTRIAPPPPQG